MVEFGEAGFFADFVFEFVDGAWRVDGIDAAAVGADEVVAVNAGKQKSEVSCAFVEAKSADHAFFAETLEEAKDGGLIALFG